jgi:parvulin-like peptidyl-prolyl isomerase
MAFKSQRLTTLFFSFILIISISLYLSCNNTSPKINNNTLAVVGEKKIEIDYFKERYKDFRSQTGVSDNGQARRSLLKNIINEELLINEARTRDYDTDPEGQHELERIKIQEMLNAYHKKMISDKVEVNEDELHTLFIQLNTKIKARHLYAPTYEQASSLYEKLQNGETFEELAKRTFKDPVLRNSGGLLGYFSVDEMDPAFEEAAYDLKIGEISKPVRTNDGYSIILVEDIEVKPLLTEYEYAKHRSKLIPFLKKRKSKKMTQQYVGSLKKSLNIKFNDQTVHRLFLALNHNEDEIHSPTEQLINFKEIDEIENNELVSSDLGIWDVKSFQEHAKFTSEKQRSWIRTEENLKDFISGLVVRGHMLSETKNQNLHKTFHYKKAVAENFDTYLLERIEKDLYQEIEIPEDSLLSYYNQDPQRFAIPPKVNLREIVLENASDTTLIATQLEKGISFSKLAKEYSSRRWSAENGGELGYLTHQDLGRWSHLAFSIEEGKWIGPVKMDSYYVFLECIDKIPTKIQMFKEVRSDVEEALRTMWWEKERSKKLNEIRQEVYSKSFPEKLLTIRLN